MSRCAACNKVLSERELALQDRFFQQEPNDLCRNCRNIVADPSFAEYIDQDGPDVFQFSNWYPLSDDDEDTIGEDSWYGR